jgi:Na+:H+ antiporter, NhaA family
LLRTEHVKVGVLTGTLLAALLAAVLLRLRDRRYRRIAEADVRDADADGIPDVFQRPDDSIPGQPADERSGERRRTEGRSLET